MLEQMDKILPNLSYDGESKASTNIMSSASNTELEDGRVKVINPKKPSIAVSMIWNTPSTINNTNIIKDNRQYISNLMESSKNHDFGITHL